LELPESYESKRIERVETLLDIASYDFQYSMPPNHKLVAEFTTYYKNILCEDASYKLSVSPLKRDVSYAGSIRIFSKDDRRDRDRWRQWHLHVDRGDFGGDMVVAGLPFRSYDKLKDTKPPRIKLNGNLFFKEASLTPKNEGQKIWHYVTSLSGEQFWRYELSVRIEAVTGDKKDS
jgi:hypothetical protein